MEEKFQNYYLNNYQFHSLFLYIIKLIFRIYDNLILRLSDLVVSLASGQLVQNQLTVGEQL